MADYSEYLTAEQLEIEEKAWAETRLHDRYVGGILRLCSEHPGIESVLEMGCVTGLVAVALPITLEYVGVDANELCVVKARERAPESNRSFVLSDTRIWYPSWRSDIVCTFSMLKHFALPEWKEVLCAVLRHGRYGLFTMSVAEECRDDQETLQTPWPHVWVSEDFLQEAVLKAGHEIIWRDNDPIEPLIATREKTHEQHHG